LSRINRRRIPAFQRAAARGDPLDIDVGCYFADFTHEYAAKTGRRIIGVDGSPWAQQIFEEGVPVGDEVWEWIYTGSAVLRDHACLYSFFPRVLLAPARLEDFMQDARFLPFRGKVSRVVLNMPEGTDGYLEAVGELFFNWTRPDGELYIRTETPDKIPLILSRAQGRPFREIPFCPEVRGINSMYVWQLDLMREVDRAPICSFAFARS